MKIIAVTQDQIIIKDGVVADIRIIGGYHMTRGEWAVHFDSELGIGHVEYIDNRSNETITQTDFDNRYQWLIDEHQRYIDDQLAQQQTEQTELAQ